MCSPEVDLMILHHKKLASLFLFFLFIKKAIFVVHIGQLYKNRQVLYLGRIKREVCMSLHILEYQNKTSLFRN